jgi:hypothetical protein
MTKKIYVTYKYHESNRIEYDQSKILIWIVSIKFVAKLEHLILYTFQTIDPFHFGSKRK